MFFENLRSERELMQVAADRPCIHWYLDYDLGESLIPDHPSLTRIRERYGLVVFPRFFEEMVELLCRGRTGVGRGAVLRLGQGGGERYREHSAPQVRG
jgi:hypothetical protein